MKVTVVIPTYNRTSELERAIKSIVNQEFSSIEVIVVDDGSNEETKEFYKGLLKKYEFHLLFRESGPKGANQCRTIGFEQASGEYIKWLDSDDELINGALLKQVEVLDASNFDVTVSNAEVYNRKLGDEPVMVKLWSKRIQSNNLLEDYIKGNVRWPSGAPLWRKSYFSESPYDVRQFNSQEWLMHCTVIAKKPNVHYAERPTAAINYEDNRMSSYWNRNATYFYNQMKARWRLMNKVQLPLRLKLLLLKYMLVYVYHACYAKVFGRPMQ